MTLLWSGYQYRPWDGYGRFGAYMVKALLRAGIDVKPILEEEANMPGWMKELRGVSFDDRLTISCLPPYFVQKVPGRHWLLSMTEGDSLPDGWLTCIENADIERVIVPCAHNAEAFARGGVNAAITILTGGTEPDDFPLRKRERSNGEPYTFLAFADRGLRKGWTEVWSAFYKEFGSVNDSGDVRLILKCRPNGNDLIDMIMSAENQDPRVTCLVDDMENIAEMYARVDCLVLPSRSEGFGMPHREASMTGLPVITQRYSGMDDGHTDQWAIVVEAGHMEPIASKGDHIAGQWRRADITELGAKMRWCYENPCDAVAFGRSAAQWLRQHQTWDHSATALITLMQQEGVFEPERVLT